MEILDEIIEKYGEVVIGKKNKFVTKKKDRFKKEDINTVAMLIKGGNLDKEKTDYCFSFLMCSMRVIAGKVISKMENEVQLYPEVREDLESDLYVFVYEALDRWKVDYDFQTEFIYYFKSKMRKNLKREYSVYTLPYNESDISLLNTHRDFVNREESHESELRGKIDIDTKIFIVQKYGQKVYYDLVNGLDFPPELSEDMELLEVLREGLISKNKVESDE